MPKQARVFNPCPKCGSELEIGYGLAFGSGIGAYEFCPDETCGYHEKFPDPEMENAPPSEKKSDDAQ